MNEIICKQYIMISFAIPIGSVIDTYRGLRDVMNIARMKGLLHKTIGHILI